MMFVLQLLSGGRGYMNTRDIDRLNKLVKKAASIIVTVGTVQRRWRR